MSASFGLPARHSRTPARADVAGGLQLLALLIALMWVSEIVDTALGHRLDAYGIVPRDPEGLIGIVTAPFLHLGFGHLIANTLPLVTLGGLVALSGATRLVSISAVIALVGGIGTWLVSPPNTITIGASGLVFGYAGYLVSRGLFTRRISQVLLGVLVVLLWGGALLSGLMPQAGISWQGHLFGAIGGLVAAWLIRPTRT
jgi:membrane associated rhomboid family serine protease